MATQHVTTKPGVRPSSIRPTQEAVVLFVTLTACALFGSILTNRIAERLLFDGMQGDAQDIARSAALLIDPVLHEELAASRTMWSDQHKEALEPLISLHRSFPEITRIRSVRRNGAQLTVVLDTETVAGEIGLTRPVDPQAIGEVLSEADVGERAVLEKAIQQDDVAAETMTDPTQYGSFLSGAAPLPDGSGAVEAELDVAAQEYSLGEVQAWARAGGALAILASGIVSVIFFSIRSAHVASLTTGAETAHSHSWLQRRNETLVRALGQIVLHRGLKDDVLLWDGETGQLLGTNHENMPLTLQGWLERVHPDDRKRVERMIAEISPTEPIFESEYRVRHDNGEWCWFHERGSLAAGESGEEFAAADSVLLEITDRKRDQDERAILALIASHTYDGVSLTDRKGRIEWTNSAFERITGHSSKAARGQNLASLLARSEAPSEVSSLLDEARKGDGRVAQIELTRDSGESYWAQLELQPLMDENNEISRLVAIQSDVTSAKESERRLVMAKNAAEAADRAKSEFLAVISHEVRTPLNSIIGFTNLLLEGQLSDQQRDYIETIRSSGDNLLLLINDILDFSKSEAASVRLERKPFAIRPCLEEALDVLAQNAAIKRLELICDIGPSVPEVIIGDRARLRQIILNLAGNAVKFTGEGEVAIIVRVASSEGENVRIRFDVCDTGPGLTAEQEARLFKPFSQADSSVTRKFGGTGLGLAISKSRVTLMKGEIGVISRPGEGSSFWFEIPCTPAGDGSSRLAAAERLEGLRVLLVEKNAAQRQVLLGLLVGWGIHVEACRSGREAIFAADHRRFDIAVVDAYLSDIDGHGLIDRLRRTPRGGSASVILMTPTSLGTELESMITANSTIRRLNKPIHAAELAAALLAASHRTLGSEPTLAPLETPEPSPGQGSRVLVADDNAINRKLIDKILVKLGHTPHVVSNGVECVDALVEGDYDIVLMDVQMPEMDGLTATRKIRESGNGVPIVALTANAMPEDRKLCLNAGMTDYLCKPIRAEALAETIHRYSTVEA
ncbi:MAG: response regulator [Chthoniobacterales bacterium]